MRSITGFTFLAKCFDANFKNRDAFVNVAEKVMDKEWFVFYTKSRHEKKVRDLLIRNGYEPFLPMHKVMRQWSDRKKKVDVPLFNSYLFVRCYEHEITSVVQTPGISTVIRHNGKPAMLRADEYQIIVRFIASGLFMEINAAKDKLMLGDKAEVIDGPLAGITGIIFPGGTDGVLNVTLESINQVIRVYIPAGLLRAKSQ